MVECDATCVALFLGAPGPSIIKDPANLSVCKITNDSTLGYSLRKDLFSDSDNIPVYWLVLIFKCLTHSL